MSGYSRGDIVLVGFVFADESGRKLRPAVVVSTDRYHSARHEMVLAAITSNVDRRLYGEHRITDWKAAGLLFPSIVTGIIRTVKQTMTDRKLGSLSKPDLEALNHELRRCLGL